MFDKYIILLIIKSNCYFVSLNGPQTRGKYEIVVYLPQTPIKLAMTIPPTAKPNRADHLMKWWLLSVPELSY